MDKTPQNKYTNTYKEDDLIFSLDIGTRSVVGIVGIFRGKIFEVLDFEQCIHDYRSMNDGQIESIDLVAEVCLKVKVTLEKRMGISLEKVAIAAAGRALKTQMASYKRSITDEEITEELVRNMEYIAIGDAYEEFIKSSSDEEFIVQSFYPVGYTVLGYYLDDQPFKELVGHRGEQARIDVIAAFLPEKVVHSLYAVMKKIGLYVVSLTLEPIAAINIVVPPDIRILNIAMVDIGAGTSDIAISKNGSIVAYDMVTTAGDEITEAIMQEYLTNFNIAEKIKLSLSDFNNKVEIQDILGNVYEIAAEEIFKNISESVEFLAITISQSIVKCNGCSPLAVFLVGGGSLIPQLCTRIANCLGLSEERVKVAGNNVFDNIKLCDDRLKSPQFITPIGIGMITQSNNMNDFLKVTVNGNKTLLKNSSKNTVADALLLCGIKLRSLIGVSAKILSFTINGEPKHIKGQPPKHGELRVNGQIVALDTQIKQGDVITALPAENGKPANVTIEQVAKTYGLNIENQLLLVNSIQQNKDYIICQGDTITISNDIKNMSLSEDASKDIEIAVSVNGETVYVKSEIEKPALFIDLLNFVKLDFKQALAPPLLLLNGKEASYMTPLAHDDVVEIKFNNNKQ